MSAESPADTQKLYLRPRWASASDAALSSKIFPDNPGQRLLHLAAHILGSYDVAAYLREAIDLVRGGAEVNFISPSTRMTTLHYAASYGCRPLVRALITSGRCDVLIRDAQGRYPFEVAIESTPDFAIARLLAKHHCRQAVARGDFTREATYGREHPEPQMNLF